MLTGGTLGTGWTQLWAISAPVKNIGWKILKYEPVTGQVGNSTSEEYSKDCTELPYAEPNVSYILFSGMVNDRFCRLYIFKFILTRKKYVPFVVVLKYGHIFGLILITQLGSIYPLEEMTIDIKYMDTHQKNWTYCV